VSKSQNFLLGFTCRPLRSGSPDGRLGRLFGFARGAIATGAALAVMGLAALRNRARPLVGALERLGCDGTRTDGRSAGDAPACEQELNMATKARVRRAVRKAVKTAVTRAVAAAKGVVGSAEPADETSTAVKPATPAKETASPGGGDLSPRDAGALGHGEAPRGDAADLPAQAAADVHHVALSISRKPDAAPLEPAARAAARIEPEHIPWGYGRDRVTAAAVDPDRLYVYWEATDEGIALARAALGPAGPGAWLVVRVSDVTGVLFDGTNAHRSFDHRVGRGDRQWFFDVNRPTSSVVVELGLRSAGGGFERLARAARVEFPRRGPVAWAPAEWMTVVAETGEVRHTGSGAPGRPAAAPGQGLASGPGPGADGDHHAPSFSPIPLWIVRDPVGGHARWVRELTDHGWERVEWQEVNGEGWFELLGSVAWQAPRTVTSWEAGPFSHPVEVEPPTREAWEGSSIAWQVGGVTRIVHGPWRVVIRNLGAYASRQVLGTWRVYRSWITDGGKEVQQAPAASTGAPPGASEHALLRGASERVWGGGSELRIGGGSEVWHLGASELRFAGASERLRAGASERIARGASERLAQGASEWALRGGSEQVLRGASERVRKGASERMLGGASERAWQGASERTYQGASERRLAGSEERLSRRDTAPEAPRTNLFPEAE
jgi:hypothetical protein